MLNLIRLASVSLVLGTAIATPTQQLGSETGNAPLTPALLDTFKFYAQHAAAVYCNVDQSAPGDAIFCTSNGCPRLERNNITIASIAKGPVTGIGAYVAIDHVRKEVVFTVRGTTNIRNFITDARFWLKSAGDITEGAQVDAGFLAAWNEISDQARNGIQAALQQNTGYRLVVVGHSLGSATAIVATSYLRQQYPGTAVFGYGVPRVGNEVFADFVSNQDGGTYRIEHYNDAVSNLPPMFLGYRHTNMEYWLSTGPANKIDYTIDQIKVCVGNANMTCSGSLLVPDITGIAHRYILWDLYACGGLQFIP